MSPSHNKVCFYHNNNILQTFWMMRTWGTWSWRHHPWNPRLLHNYRRSTLNREDTTWYRCILGSLQYLTTTWPDISFTVSKMSQFFTCPVKCHWQALQRILWYISENLFIGILIRPTSSTNIEVFSNVDWAGDVSNRRSHGGFIVYCGENIVSWQLKKQTIVARSSTEVENTDVA